MSGSDDGSRALTGRRAVVAGLLLGLLASMMAACGRRGDLELPASEAADDAEDERRARDALGG